MPEASTKLSLIWQPTSKGMIFDRLHINKLPKQAVNHFEFHKEISTKIGLVKNLQQYCELNKINLFDLTPATFIIDLDDKYVEYDVQEFVKFFQACDMQLQSQQTQNQTLNTYGSKDNNTNNSINYSQITSPSGYLPPNKFTSYANLSHGPYYAYSKPKMYNTFVNGSNLWLMKPTDLNRGRGITLFNNLKRFHQQLQSGPEQLAANITTPNNNILNTSPNGLTNVNITHIAGNKILTKRHDTNTTELLGPSYFRLPNFIRAQKFVLQKYIESPMLINRRKFDIRVWVLLDHEMNLYFFKEGYLRLSSEIFTLDESTIENQFVHLTNNAIQKYSTQYGRFESGNQLSFANFEVNLLSFLR